MEEFNVITPNIIVIKSYLKVNIPISYMLNGNWKIFLRTDSFSENSPPKKIIEQNSTPA